VSVLRFFTEGIKSQRFKKYAHRRHHIGSLTHSLMELSPPWNLPIVQLLKNFPAFYGTRRFIAVFTRALHWYLSRARSSQSIPSHAISLRSIHPPTSWSSQWSPTFRLSHQYPTCIPPLPPSCYMPFPSHPPWLVHSNYTWRRAQVTRLLIMQFSSTSCHFISLWSNVNINFKFLSCTDVLK
jgi:hypothetical protein